MNAVMIESRFLKILVPLLGFAIPALAASSVEVIQKDRHFNIPTIKVARGTTIKFSNQDEFIHHIGVDATGFVFDSGEQLPGQSVQISFNRNGIFDVHCAIHPKMHLTVEVQ